MSGLQGGVQVWGGGTLATEALHRVGAVPQEAHGKMCEFFFIFLGKTTGSGERWQMEWCAQPGHACPRGQL